MAQVPSQIQTKRRVTLGTFRATDTARQYVNQVLDSGRLSHGPFLEQFEKKFAALHNCQYGLTSNSGTSSLLVALQAMKEIHGWKDGDEVLVPAVTFVATANIVLHCRMKPVFVDVDPLFYGIDPQYLAERTTPRTRAIIPVHLFGQPCDMGPIREFATARDLKIIEDSCETMFATYRGEPVGSLGDIGCFSTYVAHLIVTGVGGMNTTNNPEYAQRMHSLLNHGRDPIYLSIDDDKNCTGKDLENIVDRRFLFPSAGHSFRLTEMEGALGLAALENWEPMIRTRQENAALLGSGLRDLEDRIQLPAIRPGTSHSFMMFPLVLRDEAKGDLVHFLEDRGIETRDMFPLITQPVYQERFGLREDEYPVARWINRSGFYVGCHQDLSREDLVFLVDAIREYLQRI